MQSGADSLFAVEASPAPRLAWRAANGLALRDYQDRRNGGWSFHSLNTARFLLHNPAMTRYASGATEDEAEQAYCARYDLPWWKLAEWNGAMAEAMALSMEF